MNKLCAHHLCGTQVVDNHTRTWIRCAHLTGIVPRFRSLKCKLLLVAAMSWNIWNERRLRGDLIKCTLKGTTPLHLSSAIAGRRLTASNALAKSS